MNVGRAMHRGIDMATISEGLLICWFYSFLLSNLDENALKDFELYVLKIDDSEKYNQILMDRALS